MQNLDERVRFLRAVSVYKGLDDRRLNRLAERFNERSDAATEMIVSQGALGIGRRIMVTGCAQVVCEQTSGAKAVVSVCGGVQPGLAGSSASPNRLRSAARMSAWTLATG